jgi:hypothetical protein
VGRLAIQQRTYVDNINRGSNEARHSLEYIPMESTRFSRWITGLPFQQCPESPAWCERAGEGSEIEVVLAEVIHGEIIFWLGTTV